MRKGWIYALFICMTLSGCAAPAAKSYGTTYDSADIPRSEYIKESKEAQKTEVEDLIAEAEAAAKAMGDYVPASKREEMQEVLNRKNALQTKIRAFAEAYPDVELDTVLPTAEISKSAFTWINAAKEELEKQNSSTSENQEEIKGQEEGFVY